MEDPGDKDDLYNHTGYHPLNLQECAQKIKPHEVERFADSLNQWMEDGGQRLAIICICKKERHRSVAIRHLLSNYLTEDPIADLDDNPIYVEQGPVPRFGKHMCTFNSGTERWDCAACEHRIRKLDWYVGSAYKIFGQKLEDAFKTSKKDGWG